MQVVVPHAPTTEVPIKLISSAQPEPGILSCPLLAMRPTSLTPSSETTISVGSSVIKMPVLWHGAPTTSNSTVNNKDPSGIVIGVKLLSNQATENLPASKNTCGVPNTEELKPGTEVLMFLIVRNFKTFGFQLTEYWTTIRSVKLSTLKSMSIISPGLASVLVMLKMG